MLLRLTCLLLLSLCLPLTALAENAPLNEVRPGLYAGGQPSGTQLRALAAQGVPKPGARVWYRDDEGRYRRFTKAVATERGWE